MQDAASASMNATNNIRMLEMTLPDMIASTMNRKSDSVASCSNEHSMLKRRRVQ
jgi:hypothetical protein